MTHQERIQCIEAHHAKLTNCDNIEQREAHLERLMLHKLAIIAEVERLEREYMRSA